MDRCPTAEENNVRMLPEQCDVSPFRCLLAARREPSNAVPCMVMSRARGDRAGSYYLVQVQAGYKPWPVLDVVHLVGKLRRPALERIRKRAAHCRCRWQQFDCRYASCFLRGCWGKKSSRQPFSSRCAPTETFEASPDGNLPRRTDIVVPSRRFVLDTLDTGGSLDWTD